MSKVPRVLINPLPARSAPPAGPPIQVESFFHTLIARRYYSGASAECLGSPSPSLPGIPGMSHSGSASSLQALKGPPSVGGGDYRRGTETMRHARYGSGCVPGGELAACCRLSTGKRAIE